MRKRFLCPLSQAGACMQQSLSGSSGQEPPLSCWITSRLAGIRGGPQGAVSDVGDPTERLTLLPALHLPNDDVVRLPARVGPLRESPLTPSILSVQRAHLLLTVSGPRGESPPTASVRVPACRGSRPASPSRPPAHALALPGSWAAACCRLVRVVVKLISCSL